MIAQLLTPQFLGFLLTGGFAAAVNFGSRIVYNQWLSYSSAVIAAYLTGMLTAFILAKLFVFRDTSQTLGHSVLWFCLVNAFAILQTWLVSLGLAFYIFPKLGIDFYPKELAHAIGVMIPVFTSYLGHKHLSFK